MQVVIYTRISKDREGAGLGVKRQRQDCTELAAQLGWTVTDVFTDNDISAYSGRARPGYQAMCAALQSGKAQAVIAWHPDRLHRRPSELEGFIDLCEVHEIEVRTVKAGELDLSTPAGQLVARMLGAAARHEVDQTVARQKRAKKQAAIEGKFRGSRRPFGYEADGITPRPVEADAIRRAAERVLTGVSLNQISRDWNAAGLRTSLRGNEFNSRDVRKVLLRPRNAGIALHEGKPIAVGQWDQIIDADTFAALEALLKDPQRSTHIGYERKHQGSGIYVCGRCGAKIASATQKAGRNTTRKTLVYVCSAARHLGRAAEYVDAFVDEVVIGRLSRPDAAIVLGGPDAATTAGLHSQREGFRARLDELGAMFADGSIDGPQLKRGSAELHARLDAIDAQLAAARAASAVANLVLSGDDLRATWRATPPDVRGKVIDALMTVTLLPAGRGRQPGGTYFNPKYVRIDWKP
jgi:DNA invertase Pin-like site-specific DNA recombinase